MEFIEEEEEMTLLKRQLMSRSTGIMEGHHKGVGEVRKVNVVYYLSINGEIDQPHLIRVHVHCKGVRLRDVKRWLSELRGEDMPDSFAWSYKRQYKSGYVWQDLVDDDLITPISDNEYILKGSQLPSSSFPFSSLDAEEEAMKDDISIEIMDSEEEKEMTPPKPMQEMRKIELDQVFPVLNKPSDNLDILGFLDGRRCSNNEEQKAPCLPTKNVAETKKRSKNSWRGAVCDILGCRKVETNGTPLLSVHPQRRESRNRFNYVAKMLPICIWTPVKV